jgi:hypothetical protein
MAEAKKSTAASKPVKTAAAAPALPPVGSAEYKAMVLRGEIKE